MFLVKRNLERSAEADGKVYDLLPVEGFIKYFKHIMLQRHEPSEPPKKVATPAAPSDPLVEAIEATRKFLPSFTVPRGFTVLSGLPLPEVGVAAAKVIVPDFSGGTATQEVRRSLSPVFETFHRVFQVEEATQFSVQIPTPSQAQINTYAGALAYLQQLNQVLRSIQAQIQQQKHLIQNAQERLRALDVAGFISNQQRKLKQESASHHGIVNDDVFDQNSLDALETYVRHLDTSAATTIGVSASFVWIPNPVTMIPLSIAIHACRKDRWLFEAVLNNIRHFRNEQIGATRAYSQASTHLDRLQCQEKEATKKRDAWIMHLEYCRLYEALQAAESQYKTQMQQQLPVKIPYAVSVHQKSYDLGALYKDAIALRNQRESKVGEFEIALDARIDCALLLYRMAEFYGKILFDANQTAHGDWLPALQWMRTIDTLLMALLTADLKNISKTHSIAIVMNHVAQDIIDYSAGRMSFPNVLSNLVSNLVLIKQHHRYIQSDFSTALAVFNVPYLAQEYLQLQQSIQSNIPAQSAAQGRFPPRMGPRRNTAASSGATSAAAPVQPSARP